MSTEFKVHTQTKPMSDEDISKTRFWFGWEVIEKKENPVKGEFYYFMKRETQPFVS